MAKGLTDIAIRNMRPGTTRREIPDGKGLYVVVQPSGRTSYAVRYRFDGRPRKLTLPSGVTLAGARKLAADAMFDLAQGRDPAAVKLAAKQAQRLAKQDTFQAVAAEWLRRESLKPEEKRLRSLRWREQVFRRHVYSALADRPIADIKRSELVRMLDQIEERGGTVMADRVLAITRVVFNWHAARSDDFRSPIVRGMARVSAEERARDRILTDDELRTVWLTAAEGRDAFDYLIRFLLLTCARKSEASRMTWSELSGDGVWTLPASRNKTKVTLARPLSQAARDVLSRLPRIANSQLVFTTDGNRPLGGFGDRKARFDERCGVSGWTIHDLRRTGRSLLSRAGIGVDIAERCLGHALPGVRGVYDRHQYRAEMLHAYEALAVQIERILHPQDNVTALPARGGQ
jgi:integrase